MTTQEFIENESFRRWVFLNTPNEATRWEAYLTQHPDYRENADLARTFLLTAQGKLPEVTDQQVNEAVGQILSAAPSHRQGLLRPLSGWPISLRIAASVALLLTISGLAWRFWQQNQRLVSSNKPSATSASVAMTEYVNRQQAPRLVRLADGSLVVLQQYARIRFPSQFSGPKRDVNLTGKAFFEVVRNPARPFRVFTRGVTTEVLGTSFLINAPEAGGNVNVMVKTGKVAVSTNPGFVRKGSDNRATASSKSQPAAVVLLPNEQATFSQNDARLVKREVSPVEATGLPATTQGFAFRRTPLPVVLDALAKAYGIPIQFDRDALAGCTLTARLDDPSLFARLDVIAASTGSSYELQNGQLIIHSSGCR
ncbi:FecR family protein [Spirosoma fluminis]